MMQSTIGKGSKHYLYMKQVNCLSVIPNGQLLTIMWWHVKPLSPSIWCVFVLKSRIISWIVYVKIFSWKHHDYIIINTCWL